MTTTLTSPSEPSAAVRVVHGVRRILSNWDNFIQQPREGDLVMLGGTSPGPGLLPSFMLRLFWKMMDEAAEGVGVGGGAGHEGGGKGAPRVMVEYSYEEEEEIEEDTSREAHHGGYIQVGRSVRRSTEWRSGSGWTSSRRWGTIGMSKNRRAERLGRILGQECSSRRAGRLCRRVGSEGSSRRAWWLCRRVEREGRSKRAGRLRRSDSSQ
ncbi:unnamed protein product [Closterium sp. NIES-54]